MIGSALTLIAMLACWMLAVPPSGQAQPAARVSRIGVLHGATAAAVTQNFEALKQEMRALGYVEGKNVVYERRAGDARAERISELAAELVRLKVDVIVAATDPAIAAVKQQTRTIPIVMATSTDPLGTGFVTSLARPGGNVTGLSTISPELSAKRLELLREAIPGLSRVAILWNPDVRGAVLDYRGTEEAARSLRVRIQSVEVNPADDLADVFASLVKERPDALIVAPYNPWAFANRARIAAQAQKHRLPSMFGPREFADAGGLMAYAPSATEQWRRAATYVDKILKGAKPADLPVEQPTQFELVINLKTARALGLTVPATLLRRADHVIE